MSYPVIYTDNVHTEVVSDVGNALPIGIRDTRIERDPEDILWYFEDEARALAAAILACLDSPSVEKTLAQAAEDSELVRFIYCKSEKSEPEVRTLRPSEVYESQTHDKLVIGYDEDRDDVRVFRLDRIRGASVVSA